jgi:DNA-binding transcriptional ArsR family regulator
LAPEAEVDIVYQAIANHTRRAILELLSDGPRPANEIASRFTMSQPAVSQQLQVLLRASLVRTEARGRQRIYSLEAGRLQEVFHWVEHYRRFWPKRLQALGKYLDRQK